MKDINDAIAKSSNTSLIMLACAISFFVILYYGFVASVWVVAPDLSTALMTVIFSKSFFCMSLILRRKQLLQEPETRNNKDLTRNLQDSGEGLGGVDDEEDDLIDCEILTAMVSEPESEELDADQSDEEYRKRIDSGTAPLKVKDAKAAYPALNYEMMKAIWNDKFNDKKLNRAIRYRPDGSVHQCRYSYPEVGQAGGVETKTGGKVAA